MFQRLRGEGIRRLYPRGGHQNNAFRGYDYMIPCMVGKFAQIQFISRGGWLNKFQRGAILGPSPPKTGTNLLQPLPLSIFKRLLGDSKRITSHIPNWHRVRAITKTTSLDRLRLVFSSTWRSYKPHAQPRAEPNLHNTLLRVKRSGSKIPGQVYDYCTSQEGAVPGQELDRWREGTLNGPSGKCTRNLPHW